MRLDLFMSDFDLKQRARQGSIVSCFGRLTPTRRVSKTCQRSRETVLLIHQTLLEIPTPDISTSTYGYKNIFIIKIRPNTPNKRPKYTQIKYITSLQKSNIINNNLHYKIYNCSEHYSSSDKVYIK